MNRRPHAHIVLTALVWLLFNTGQAASGATTAKVPLPAVLAAAKTWQGDAVLVSLSSTTVHPDGSAADWKYSFYSPATKKRCVVTASASGVRAREVNLGFSTQSLGDFIDSDKAMEEAHKNGLKGKEPNMGVKFQETGSGQRACWIVNGGTEKGDTSILLEAKTGKFLSRVVME